MTPPTLPLTDDAEDRAQAIGVELMADSFGWLRTGKLLVASLVVALVIELPLRGYQAERIVRPYVEASQYLENIDADIVVAYFEDIRWGRQLLRNDPFGRNTPKLMGFAELRPPGLDSLKRLFPGRVRFVTTPELQRFIPNPRQADHPVW